jgi:hypothetical protein
MAVAALFSAGEMVSGFAQSTSAGSSASNQSTKASEVYKNLHVLGELPADQLLSTMQFMARSLGVQCSFCHEREPEKDLKEEKRKARRMLRMVYDLNDDRFMTFRGNERQITCDSCHHGNQIPGKFRR